MVTMVDEIFDRHYQAGRNELNASLLGAFTRFGEAFGNAFKVLNRRQKNSTGNSTLSAEWHPKPLNYR